MTQYYTGTSGWYYEHWRNRFYPLALPKTKRFGYYSRYFNTVELNNSFYNLPSEKAFATWRELSPTDFIFAVKISRYITHIKRLIDCEEPLNTFLGRAEGLQAKLGPLLYQLPPNMHRNDGRLESFLSILPEKFKHVFEFRHPSWFNEEIFEMLHEYHAGFCIFDIPAITCPVMATTDFAYIRFHGKESLYASNYTDAQFADWASKIRSLAVGANLNSFYIYFNNDAEAFAVNNALTMRHSLEQK